MPVGKVVEQAKQNGGNDSWVYLLNSPPKEFSSENWSALDEGAYEADYRNSSLARYYEGGFALSVQAPCFNTLVSAENYTRRLPSMNANLQKYIDYVVKEVRLLKQNLPAGSQVKYLHWFGDLVRQLTPAAQTQVMYYLGREFKLNFDADARHVIELDARPDSEEALALIKGLGFNIVCINDPGEYAQSFPIESLRDWLQTIRAFDFKAVYLRLKVTPATVTALSEHLEEILTERPQGILLSGHKMEFAGTAGLEAALKDFKRRIKSASFIPITQDFFALPWTGLISQGVSCLHGVGLGAFSYTPHYQLRNATQLDDYYKTLDNSELPARAIRYTQTQL
ncbi:hypothetical protein [Hahella sp. NBU794]|uniref:hypothetical protein n=1 Tax=Hahella sp. NBU794 TaxID=3422590 RepID=UPI003D6F89FB